MTQPIINPAAPQKPTAFKVEYRGEAEPIPFARLALLFVASGWTWSLNNRCKHLTIFMDTRDAVRAGEGSRMCRVYDRNEVGLTAAELAHQLELPRLPGESVWTDRDISLEEMRNGMELSARIIEAGEKERQELCAKVAELEAKAGQLDAIVQMLDEGFAPNKTVGTEGVRELTTVERVGVLIRNCASYARGARENADKVLELRNELAQATHRITVEKERGDELLAEGKALEELAGKLWEALRVARTSLCGHVVEATTLQQIDDALKAVPSDFGKELDELRERVAKATLLTPEQVATLRDLSTRAAKHRSENRLNAGMMVCEQLTDAVAKIVGAAS